MNIEDFALTLITEGFCALIIGPAFAMLFVAPKEYLGYIALGSVVARVLRQSLYLSGLLEIVSATFIASAVLSMIFIYFAPRLEVPRPVFIVASVICLVPGLDLYNALLALISILDNTDQDVILGSIVALFQHGMRAIAILTAMCLGLAIMPLFFYRYRFHHL